MIKELPALLLKGGKLVAGIEDETSSCLGNLEMLSGEEIERFLQRRQELVGELQTVTAKIATLDKPTVAKYEQVRKARKGLAVAEMVKGHCTACHMSLRPAVEGQIKRNEAILQCDSCQ